jgi:hypothetical protein
MTDHEIRLSRRESERLLDDPAAHDSALGWALSAANAPAHRGELRREDAEVAAFHAARLSPPPTTRSNYVSPASLGRRAAARAVVATGAIVALTSGGFALASSVDLPTLPGQASDRASDRATGSVAQAPEPTRTTSSTSSTTPTGRPSRAPGTKTSKKEQSEGAETPGASPRPSFTGLCKAYQATDRSKAGKSLDSAAFTALATEAGGADQVATYCVALIGEPRETGRPTDKPAPGKPTDKPAPGRPTDKPAPGKPTDKPAPGKPTDKPSPDKPGKPTDKPAPSKGGKHN